jgi:signal transduction histidine kinase
METRLRVLLVEDDRGDQKAFERVVKVEKLPYQYVIVSSCQEAEQALLTNSFDIVLCDYSLEDGTALDVLGLAQDVPLIVITGVGDEKIAVQTMKAGAVDYLSKDMSQSYLHILPVVIENTLKRKHTERLAEQQARLLAVNEERQRIAHDFHDSLSQTLYSISTITNVLLDVIKHSPETVEASVEQLKQLSSSALTEMRTILTEMRPVTMEGHTLCTLLETLIESRRRHTRTQLTLTCEECALIPPETQWTIYRIIQEALNNIIKHANAKQATFQLHVVNSRVQLRIQDNGCGFDTLKPLEAHYGLAIMRERAANIGAALTVTSEVGKGTTILVDWLHR